MEGFQRAVCISVRNWVGLRSWWRRSASRCPSSREDCLGVLLRRPVPPWNAEGPGFNMDQQPLGMASAVFLFPFCNLCNLSIWPLSLLGVPALPGCVVQATVCLEPVWV
eukprot:1141068-Pelagomonas_calceolata.AAC.2